jgi:transcriptional regulator with XRE-family HTH domain
MATVHAHPQFRDRLHDRGPRRNDVFVDHRPRDPGNPLVGRAAVDAAAEPGEQASLHRIAEVRQLQGVTLRNVARRLGMSLPVVRRQEQSDSDLRISDLLRWQQVLEVPVAELLVEGDGQLSGPVLQRSRMVKLMKTAAVLRERTAGTPAAQAAEMLVSQILEIMPELADVTPWQTPVPRRSGDDVGRAARGQVPDTIFHREAP